MSLNTAAEDRKHTHDSITGPFLCSFTALATSLFVLRRVVVLEVCAKNGKKKYSVCTFCNGPITSPQAS